MNTPSVTTSIRVAARDFGGETDAVADGHADRLAQCRRHARGRGTGGEPARREHEDFLFTRPGLAGEHERHPRGLAGAGRRDQNRDVPRAQSAGQLRQRGIDRKRLCVLVHQGTLLTSPGEGARVEDKCIARPGRWRNRRSSVKSKACQPKPKSAPTAPKMLESAVQARPPQKGDHVFLVDGSSYIFRAYHALPPLHRKSDGLQVNAVLGFCNMLWKLLARHEAGGAADPSGGRVRQVGEDVPQRDVFRVQGQSHRAARRSAPAIRLHPRSGARLRPAVPGADRLRGRRPDRDLCAARLRGGRQRNHRVLRQGPDAARERLRRHVRHDEGSQDRHPGGGREIRRAAGEGDRGAVPDRRFHRQRAGRAGHRREDRGAAHRRIRRPRNAARARRRDQAGEAAPGADRQCRAGAAVEEARHPRRPRGAGRAARRLGGARARLQAPHRLPQGDGVQHPHAAGGGILRHRGRADRCGRQAFVGLAPRQGRVGGRPARPRDLFPSPRLSLDDRKRSAEPGKSDAPSTTFS